MPKTRFKTHRTPGDVGKTELARMLEGKHPDKKRAKGYKKDFLERERVVLRERTRKEIQETMPQPVKKDEYCDCTCHDVLGFSHDKCPLCYFSDGNSDLNRRIDEHLKMLDKQKAEGSIPRT